jgi:FlaA1/EpsC-like NDP-sugar epimerase
MKVNKKHLIMLFIDIFLINLTMWFSFFLRFEGRIPLHYGSKWLYYVVLVTFFRIGCFYYFGLYKSLWSYSSLPELIQIIKAVTVSSVLITFVDRIMLEAAIPRSVLFISWVLHIITIGGARFAIRIRREVLTSLEVTRSMSKRVLIVGAGQAGALIIKEMMQNSNATHWPVAVVDDDYNKINQQLHGVPVVGTVNELVRVANTYRVDAILIAIPSAPKSRVREIVAQAKETGLTVSILPGLMEMAREGSVTLDQVREVRIEDLLGRKPVRLHIEEVAGYLKGERVLITGAGGSIGSELCRQVAKFEPEVLLLLGRGENSIYEIDQELRIIFPTLKRIPIIADVRDYARLEQIFKEFRPTVLFHAAAHKHVPLMEAAPDEAVKNNIFGTKNVAELADEYGIKRFVLISTDKAVNPTSVMGTTKRVAEMIVQQIAAKSKTKFCAVRFGNVLGSRGSVIPLFQQQIARGGPVTVTHPEMVRFFMTIPEAVSLVIQAGAMGERGEIFILDMGEPVKIMDLANDLIRLSGLVPGKDIQVSYTGIRPGEKLYEEILTAEEGTNATRHERIYVSKPNGVNPERLQEDLIYLEKWVSVADRVKVIEKLYQMVPKYTPSKRWIEEMTAAGKHE